MTGPEHYAEAERLLASYPAGLDVLDRASSTNHPETAAAVAVLTFPLAAANVHATLALAAAAAGDLPGWEATR